MSLLKSLSAILGAAAILFCGVNLIVGALVYQYEVSVSEANTGGMSNRSPNLAPPRQLQILTNDMLATTHHYDPGTNLEPIPRPPLDSIVQEWNITGDPSWLIQFSIVGFPKCGTSTLMHHLESHPEIIIPTDERCELAYNQQKVLIEDLYRQYPRSTPEQRYVRGIKCPMDLESTQLSMRNYERFFPHTDFIVGIRHPVLWFESFYNFRIQNQFRMPPPETLVGKCRRGWNNVCTFRANFHIFLSNLGHTNMKTSAEEKALVPSHFHRAMDSVPMPHRRVFLYDVSQLSDPDDERAQQLRVDLQDYLHLKRPIDPFIWFKPGRNHTDADEAVHAKIEERKMDICEHQYTELRAILQATAESAATWIRRYFVPAHNVHVSSPEHFDSIMASWHEDPCVARMEKKRLKKAKTNS